MRYAYKIIEEDKMKIERRDVGFGMYQWYIDDSETDMEESEIIHLVSEKGYEDKFWSLWNYQRFFTLEIGEVK